MNNVKRVSMVLGCLCLTACANVRGPLQAGLSFYKAPLAMTTATAQPTKHGEACAQNFLGLIAVGDASIDTAKKNAGINKVTHVDHITGRVLGYYARFCTVVTGE